MIFSRWYSKYQLRKDHVNLKRIHTANVNLIIAFGITDKTRMCAGYYEWFMRGSFELLLELG